MKLCRTNNLGTNIQTIKVSPESSSYSLKVFDNVGVNQLEIYDHEYPSQNEFAHIFVSENEFINPDPIIDYLSGSKDEPTAIDVPVTAKNGDDLFNFLDIYPQRKVQIIELTIRLFRSRHLRCLLMLPKQKKRRYFWKK